MTDLLTLAANHPYWFTLWFGMACYTLIETARRIRGKAAQ